MSVHNVYFSNKSEFSSLPAIESFFQFGYLIFQIKLLGTFRIIRKVHSKGENRIMWPLKTEGFLHAAFHVPNDMASVLLVLICRSLTFLNSSKSFNNLGTES